MPQLPLSPCMAVALFFHYPHRQKALSCCALTAVLSFAFQFQHKVASTQQTQNHHGPSAHAALAGQPWQGREQRGAGGNGQSMLGATPSLPVTPLLCPDSHLHFAHPSCGSTPCPYSSSFLATGLGSSGWDWGLGSSNPSQEVGYWDVFPW